METPNARRSKFVASSLTSHDGFLIQHHGRLSPIYVSRQDQWLIAHIPTLSSIALTAILRLKFRLRVSRRCLSASRNASAPRADRTKVI